MREVIQSSETFGSNKEQHIEDKELPYKQVVS
jgi:hypothetical protein